MSFLSSGIFELLISLVLIYALLSILVSILTEWWNHYKKERGRALKEAIFKMLKDPLNHDYGDLFYNHYMIEGLKSTADRPPHYISSSMFAEVLMDVIARQAVHGQTIKLKGVNENFEKEYELLGEAPPENIMDRFKASVKLMNPSPFRDLLQSFIDKSGDGHEGLKPYIENWFNNYMDRVSGWYKAKQRKKLIYIGFIVAIGLNVDSLHLIKVLSLDNELKTNLVTTAEKVSDKYVSLSDSAKNNTSNLIQLFYEDIATDSTYNDSISEKKVNTILDYLEKRDFVRYNTIKKRIALNDSLSNTMMKKADSVLGVAAQLNTPIGWSEDSAPLSWFRKCDEHKLSQNKNIKKENEGLLSYVQSRNATHENWNWLKYLLGITISGFSLSFGAPFWFELLSKLVNIRRSGNKPKS